MYINVNTDVIERQATNADSYIEDSLTAINDIKSIMNNISSIWEGNDQKEFDKKMNEFTESIRKLETSLEKYNAFVKGYANAQNALDNHYKNKRINLK